MHAKMGMNNKQFLLNQIIWIGISLGISIVISIILPFPPKGLQQLTENILDVTKIDSHSLLLNRDLYKLSDIITTVIQDYKIQIDNLKLKLLYQPANNTSNTFIFADKSRVYQVISNLLDNAVKFTKNEDGDILVTTKMGDDNDQIVFSVKDTG